MAVNKKFEKLGVNSNYKGELPHENAPAVGRKVYSFKPAKSVQKRLKIYEVGLIPVYIMFIVSFVLALFNKIITNEGVYSSLDENIFFILRCAVYLVIFIVPALVYCKISGSEKTLSLCGIKPFSRYYSGYILLNVLLLILIIAAEKFAIAYFDISGSTSETINLFATQNKLAAIVAHAIFPAICEEIYIRGVIQTEISKKAGGFTGIILSAILFTLIHLDAKYFIVYLTSGIILASVMHITGSVIPCILMHIFNNLFAMSFSSHLTFIASERAGNMFVFIILMILVFIISLFTIKVLEKICIKKAVSVELINAEHAKIKSENNHDIKESVNFYSSPFKLLSDTGYTLHKFLRFLFSPAIIIALIIFIFANI